MMKIKFYLDKLFLTFPRTLVRAVKQHGVKGVYLALCELFGRVPFPVRLGQWGIMRNDYELLNYLDNFTFRELRCDVVEKYLEKVSSPTIIDLGINTGVTVRWWFSLNKTATVVGIDMLQEALDFTSKALAECGHSGKWLPLCSGVGSRQLPQVEISINDPLEGTSSILKPSGTHKRSIRIDTVDNLIAPLGLKKIDLIKCDIEGSGGHALLAATDTLRITEYVVAETHDYEETVCICNACIEAGFTLFRAFGRTLWWSRKAISNR